MMKSSNISGLVFYESDSTSSVIPGSGLIYTPGQEDDNMYFKAVRVKIPQNARFIRTTWWDPSNEHYAQSPFFAYGEIAGEIQCIIGDKNSLNIAPTLVDAVEALAGETGTIEKDLDHFEKDVYYNHDDIILKIGGANRSGSVTNATNRIRSAGGSGDNTLPKIRRGDFFRVLPHTWPKSQSIAQIR